jgi:hypothetical protein
MPYPERFAVCPWMAVASCSVTGVCSFCRRHRVCWRGCRGRAEAKARRDELTIAAIARRADVSRKFIYAHSDLRTQIEQRAVQATTCDTSSAVAGGQVSVASLRADAANAEAQNRRLGQPAAVARAATL